jgi:ribosomal protein S21
MADFKENHRYSSLVLKSLQKKIHETRKLESIHEKYFAERKNEDRKPDKNSNLRTPEFMPRNLD